VAVDPLIFRLRIDAPPEVVFDCFCDPNALVTWMGDWAEVEARAGGIFAVNIDDMEVRGEFKVVERARRLVFSWGFGNSDVPPRTSDVEVTFDALDGGTDLTLIHRNLPPSEVARHTIGWNEFLPVLSSIAPRRTAPVESRAQGRASA
jgi:uncharacterized protein YndB with AHSA1/START domain